ncbi:hypothetical protein PR048_000061 [Dryococelus australis]|uniref:Uncharacterized protein n=1 Tax=Dryococelus australis TaxID=614101 RepID=A0ABQ9IDK0_9NEOP|nr:hypothetical protein PR048_000061 [Dryococelus australis]
MRPTSVRLGGNENGLCVQVSFVMRPGEPCEDLLRLLGEFGIGSRLQSVIRYTHLAVQPAHCDCMLSHGQLSTFEALVNYFPCSRFLIPRSSFGILPCFQNLRVKSALTASYVSPLTLTDHDYPLFNGEEYFFFFCRRKEQFGGSAWQKFMSSVRARLTVAQVVEGVKADATLTFDFLTLLLIASLVSALGLVENSIVILVASMLISPLMLSSPFTCAQVLRAWTLISVSCELFQGNLMPSHCCTFSVHAAGANNHRTA